MPTTGVEQLPTVEVGSFADIDVDLLAILGWEAESFQAHRLPAGLAARVGELVEASGWKGRVGETTSALGGDLGATRVTLWGLGPRDEADSYSLDRTVTKLVRRVRGNTLRTLAICPPPEHLTEASSAERLARIAVLARYRFDRFKTTDEDREDRLKTVQLRGATVASEVTAAVSTGARVAGAVALSRDLANAPPNIATPAWIATRASTLAEGRISVDVLEPKALESRGMGGILAVGGGSKHDPRLVHLHYDGGGGPRVALVGKGVTFDTGGISIKPAKGMDEMKYDKCGACAVLGIMHGASELRLPVVIDAYIPLAENMVSGEAYRPGDIVRCYNGKTVEVLNTDAEGRMILADALSLAAEAGPDYLVELSTLTGASVVALGRTGAALYSPSDELADGLLTAATVTGDRLWRMPLWKEFGEAMEGTHAELRNVAGRWGGANTAAAFLSMFVGDVRRWCHIDIAGPAAVTEGAKADQGATGFGVALTLEWLRSLATG